MTFCFSFWVSHTILGVTLNVFHCTLFCICIHLELAQKNVCMHDHQSIKAKDVCEMWSANKEKLSKYGLSIEFLLPSLILSSMEIVLPMIVLFVLFVVCFPSSPFVFVAESLVDVCCGCCSGDTNEDEEGDSSCEMTIAL